MAETPPQLAALFANHLQPRGWDRSLTAGPVDADGEPLPWITYPAQSMLRQIVRPEFRVFEFGCGHSSLWWAARAREVVSVDHDEAWINGIGARRPANLTLVHRARGVWPSVTPSPEVTAAIQIMARDQVVSGNDFQDVAHGFNIADFTGYATTLTEWPKGYFDIVVVDGMARSLCAHLAGSWVKPHGLVVFDNSDRWQYSIGYEALRDLGFGRIDFFGAGPVNTYEWCTSIFARHLTAFLTVPPREKRKADLDW